MASSWTDHCPRAWTLVGVCWLIQNFADGTSTCAPNWSNHDGICFTRVSPAKTLSWEDAQRKCEQLGGTLPRAQTLVAWTALVNYRKLLPNSGDAMWIGLKLRDSVWKWASSGQSLTASSFTQWTSSINNIGPEACAAIEEIPPGSSTFAWQAYPCNMPVHYLCADGGPSPIPPTQNIGLTSFWLNAYPQSKYQNINEPGIDDIHGVTSVVSCAVNCQTKSDVCDRFNYSKDSKRCLLLNGVGVLQGSQTLTDQEWDIWERKT